MRYPVHCSSAIDRKAFDVAVLGGGLLGLTTAYRLAKQGLKVAVIESYGLPSVQRATWRQPLRSLNLVWEDPYLIDLGLQCAGTWREYDKACGSTMLQQCGSLHLRTQTRDTLAQESFDRLREACQEGGVSSRVYTAEEVQSRFPALALRRGGSALFQDDSAVLNALAAQEALQGLASRAGAVVNPTSLIGWQHKGSHFVLRHATEQMQRSGDEMICEAGQLVLTPTSACRQSLMLFGLSVKSETRRLTYGSWQLPVDVSTLPTLTWLDTRNRVSDEVATSGRCVGLYSNDSQLVVCQTLQDGQVVDGSVEQEDGNIGPDDTALRVLDAQVQATFRRVGGVDMSASGTYHSTVTPDGMPALGCHPGFESGQVVVAMAGGGVTACSMDDHLALSPIIAQMLMELIGGSSLPADAVLRLGLERDGLESDLIELDVDPWDVHFLRKLNAKLLQEAQDKLKQEEEQDSNSTFKSFWMK